MATLTVRREPLLLNVEAIRRSVRPKCRLRVVTKAIQDEPRIVSWLFEAGQKRFASFGPSVSSARNRTALDWMELNPRQACEPGTTTLAIRTPHSMPLVHGVVPMIPLQTGAWQLGRELPVILKQLRRLESEGHLNTGFATTYGCVEEQPPHAVLQRIKTALTTLGRSVPVSAGGSALLTMSLEELRALTEVVSEVRVGEAIFLGTTPTGRSTPSLLKPFRLGLEAVERCPAASTLTLDVGWLDVEVEELVASLRPHRILSVTQHFTTLRVSAGVPVPRSIHPGYRSLCRAIISPAVALAHEA